MGAGGNVVEVKSKEEWNKAISDAKNGAKAVVVDFSAEWCGPCKVISPFFAQLSTEFTQLVFLSVDVDEVESVAAECNISAMPTFQVWKDGARVEELVGASKERLEALVKKFADS